MSKADGLKSFYQTYPEAQVLPPEMYTRGVIFSVAAAPEIPMPETWMPWLVHSTSYSLTDDQVDNLAHHLMGNLRDVLHQMSEKKSCLPFTLSQTQKDNEKRELQAWLKGLLTGHQQLETIWQTAWEKAEKKPQLDGGLKNEAPDKRLRRCLKLFTTLANPKASLKGLEKAQADKLERSLPQLTLQLPGILQDYINLAGELAPFLPQQFDSFEKKDMPR
ncbi:UPF0149 family protein [Alteromonas lipotrueiana]|uniref:UPF0149 family protein n=1 Tax=Alteromonas lipotrueiana TaxID=2803815 RepID=UPI001C459A34